MSDFLMLALSTCVPSCPWRAVCRLPMACRMRTWPARRCRCRPSALPRRSAARCPASRAQARALIGAHVAVLVFLAGTAVTRIVPTERLGAADGLRRAAVPAIGLHALRHRGPRDELGVVDVADNILRHGRDQLFVHLVGFLLVGHERILLAEGAQADPLTQLVEIGQMPHPAVIDRAQHDQPLQLAQHLGAHRGLFGVIRLLGELDKMLGEFGGGELAPAFRVLAVGREDDLVQLGRQANQIPLIAIRAARKHLHQRGHLVLDHAHDRRSHGRLAEDLPPLVVDHLALLVDDVVVFQHVLAHVEVVAFDPHLGALDGLADQPVLDGHVLVQLQPIHQVGDALAAEAPHQVVFQRHVEARRAGIALAAGAAAELVVDAPGLVPLGAQDVQAAGREHLLAVGFDLRLRLRPAQPATPDHPRPARPDRPPLCAAARAPGRPRCRRAGCRRRGRPCWWRWSPCRAGPPARSRRLPSRAAWRSARCAAHPCA